MDVGVALSRLAVQPGRGEDSLAASCREPWGTGAGTENLLLGLREHLRDGLIWSAP